MIDFKNLAQLYAFLFSKGRMLQNFLFSSKPINQQQGYFFPLIQAKEALDGKKLHNNICKMSIYYSTFENVDLKHQTSEGTEYYNQKFRSHNQKSISLVSQKSPTKNMDDF